MILFDRSKFTRFVILGATPPDIHALSATLGIPDEPGTRLAIHRPSPEDRNHLLGEGFHEIGLFHKVKCVLRLTDLWSVGDRQGLRVDERIQIIRVPATRFNGLFRSGLGRTRRNANGGDIRASARPRRRLRAGPAGIEVVSLSFIDVRGARKAIAPKVWAVLGRPDRRNVDKLDTRELSGWVERTVVHVVGFQDGRSNVGNRPVVVVVKNRTSVWGGGMQGMGKQRWRTAG